MVAPLRLIYLILLAAAVPCSALATRQVTDPLGRNVTLPNRVVRLVVLQYQTLNLLVQLDATSKPVGILSHRKHPSGDDYALLAPQLNRLPVAGDVTPIDLEKCVALHPQLMDEINQQPDRQVIDAVKHHRVYLMPA